MTRIKTPLNVDDIINLYQSGKGIREISRIVHKRGETVKKVLIENGVTLRVPVNARKTDINKAAIIADYTSGMSCLAVANKYEVSRSVIHRILKESSIVIRSSSEANKISASCRTPEENAALVKSAHEAIKGKTYSNEELRKRAISRQNTFSCFTSPYEKAIANELTHKGIDFIPQFAIDKYNIDFAIWDNIALEVYGGGWHTTGRAALRFDDRSKKIFDSGRSIVICWCTNSSAFNAAAVTEYLITLNKILCSDPASRCRHYVIGGDGNVSTIGCDKLNYIS